MSPRMSVIVLRAGDSEDGPACLRGLARSAAEPGGLELISTLPSELPEWEGTGPPCRRIGSDIGDPWAAASKAAESALGEILLFIPADAVPSADIFSRHAAIHAAGGPRVVLGELEPAAGAHPLAALRRAAEPGAGLLASDFAGQTLSVATDVFRRAGGLASGVRWGAEVELAYRLGAAGAELVRLEGEAVARQHRRQAPGDLLRRRESAGQGSVELYRRWPALLPHLELGGFHAGEPSGLALRRLLCAIGGPAVPVSLGSILPTPTLRARWLRFLHEYYYWRGVRRALDDATWAGLVRPPVILMYHAIGGAEERPGMYVVPVARFQRQMAWLRRRGYRIVGLEELLAARRAFRPLPPRSVVITFDDGYADNAELALPVLRRHDFRATFFLVSGCIGGRNAWDPAGELAARPMLTWDAVRVMLDAGMEIGAHTRTHPALTALADEAAKDEIAGARADLEAALGHPTRTFAYPFGSLDDRVLAAVGAAGFEVACCSRSGVNDPVVPSLRLRRVEVRGTDSLLTFALAARRGWVRRRRRR